MVDDAEAQYLAFFASKTVGMIRAPDSYVYPAPFNLVELFLVSPFECVNPLFLPSRRPILFTNTPQAHFMLQPQPIRLRQA